MIFFVFVLAFAHAVLSQEQFQVNTTQGVVQGATAADGNYLTFYGIHYGGNTAGANRFKAPTPAPSYPGVFIAHDSSVICAQPSSRGIIGTEDCLTLSIFTNDTTVPKPTLVWITGEEYTTSDQQANFRRLATEGLVVVKLNYRLSIFGFLCLGVEEAPGNAGLKDIVQGLKWVRDNIGGFGGNPNNVILFGHGSGAAMVDLITMSPLANGLFHKAIALSGSALAPWAVSYNPLEYAHAFGAKFGYTQKSNQELAQHLISTDLSLLGNALTDFDFYNNSILFAPCIENPALNDTFLADAPLNILRSGKYSDVPFIAGYTDKEGMMRAEQAAFRQWLEKMQANFTEFLPLDLNFKDNLTNVEKSVREFYFAQRTINMDTIEDFLDYQGDTLVLVSVVRAARERALTSSSEVRLMEFAHMGTTNSDWAFSTIPLSGARHGIVLNYLLDYELKATDIPVMTSLIRRIVTFCNTGSPNPTTNNPAVWAPITASSLPYLMYSGGDPAVFSEEVKTNPHTQRMTLWNDIYSKYYVPPKAVSSSVRFLGLSIVVLISQIVSRLF